MVADIAADLFGGAPPRHNAGAEQAVLGSMLLSPDLVADLTLTPADFYRPQHATLHALLLDMYRDGLPIDPVTVHQELINRGEATRVGGAPYLHELTSVVPTVANAAYYATIIVEEAARRRLTEAGQRILQLANSDGDVDELRAAAIAAVDFDSADDSSGPQRVSDLLPAAMDAMEIARTQPVGIQLPWLDLQAAMHPIRPGQLVVIGARPAVGKSVVALDFARCVSFQQELTTAFFSMEMSKDEIAMRTLAAEGRIPLSNIIDGHLAESDWDKLAKAINKIGEHKLFVDDGGSQTVATIRARARRIRARHGLHLIIVDYMQLMNATRRADNRQQEVSEISRGLKLIAKDLAVPVIALSQLNRGLESRADKRPNLADLRESGAIEQDADTVLLLHREDMYERDSPRAGEMDIIIAKQRMGATGVVAVSFQGHYARAVDMGREWTER